MTAGRRIRVGFVLPSGEWMGGRNYLRNLFAALRSVPDNVIEPVILTGSRTGDLSSEFSGVSVFKTDLLERNTPGWLARQLIWKSSARDLMLVNVLRRHNISILSHCFHLGWQQSIKTIGWIPDFQHVHLPGLFTKKELSHRDREYRRLCEHCDKVVVSSESVKADLFAFAPKQGYKAELLKFVAEPVPLASVVSVTELQEIYNFEGDYFLLPNQFWAHKNHRVVIDALNILKRLGRVVLVLATGSTEDHRNPDFFPSLIRHAAECGVVDQFRVLGKIPFAHLVGLMRHSVALINPSHFEGWSTSVEEAKSTGKQIVLSDIAVHREQAPERGFFFPPDDPAGLAEAMLAALGKYDLAQDKAMQEQAWSSFQERQRTYGYAYIQIAQRALAG